MKEKKENHWETHEHPATAVVEKDGRFSLPAHYRKLENLHILFWLIKDICWCVFYPPLGIAMIAPTLSVAVYICWRNRNIVSELVHNLAIMLWIIANSMWMVAEFYEVDEQVRPYCLIPFSLGLVILLYYYLWVRWRSNKKESI